MKALILLLTLVCVVAVSAQQDEKQVRLSGIVVLQYRLVQNVNARATNLIQRRGLPSSALAANRRGEGPVKFRVELVWRDADADAASSIFLTADGRVILQGRAVSRDERQALALPAQGDMISVDRNLIRAIKEML